MKFFNSVNKANAELSAAEEAMRPDLEKAGITTAQHEGKTIPISDATLAEKYTALRAAQPTGTDLQARSELLESNQVIASRCEKAESDLAIAQTTIGTLTRENATLKAERDSATSANETLVKEKAEITNLRDAAVNQFTVANREIAAATALVAKECLEVGCLTFNGADGKPLAAEAALAEAKKIKHADLFTSYKGAVNATMSKLGIEAGKVPPAGGKAPTDKPAENLTGIQKTAAAFATQIARK